MKQGEIQAKFVRRRAALEVQVEITGAIKSLNIARNEELYLHETAGRYLLTDPKYQDQTGHDEFETREGQSPGFFEPACQSEALIFLDCPAFDTYVNYTVAKEKKFAEILRLEDVTIPTYAVFVGHGYAQHGGCGGRGSHIVPCYTYLIHSTYYLKVALTLVSAARLAVVRKGAANSRKKGFEQDLSETSRTKKRQALQ